MALRIETFEGGLELSVSPPWRLQNILIMLFQILGILVFCGTLFSGSARKSDFAVGLLTLVLVFLWARFWFSLTVIRITSFSLRHSHSLFGFVFSEDEYTNTDIQNLRYDEWSEGRGGIQSAVRFEYNGLTITLTRQTGPAYSQALIDQLREVFPFPVPTYK